jgi:hypothetical protein
MLFRDQSVRLIDRPSKNKSPVYWNLDPIEQGIAVLHVTSNLTSSWPPDKC